VVLSCNVILENGNLVKKVAFPCELLPIPSILVSLIVYLVGAVVLLDRKSTRLNSSHT
jgi:ABC-type polysaccharide/polyol phosphate export permease